MQDKCGDHLSQFYWKLSCSSDINNLYDSLYLFFANWPSNSSSLELGWPDTAGSWAAGCHAAVTARLYVF